MPNPNPNPNLNPNPNPNPRYHDEPASFSGSRLVGFEVEPFSVKHSYTPPFKGLDGSTAALSTCTKAKPVTHDMPPQPISGAGEVLWSYDVRWEYSDVKWASPEPKPEPEP